MVDAAEEGLLLPGEGVGVAGELADFMLPQGFGEGLQGVAYVWNSWVMNQKYRIYF